MFVLQIPPISIVVVADNQGNYTTSSFHRQDWVSKSGNCIPFFCDTKAVSVCATKARTIRLQQAVVADIKGSKTSQAYRASKTPTQLEITISCLGRVPSC